MDADFLLIHKMKNGDEEAIEVFVKKYYSTIIQKLKILFKIYKINKKMNKK